MKTYLVLLLILATHSLQAQDPPDHFVIGSWGISPDYVPDTTNVVWPVYGIWDDLAQPPDSLRRFLLPRQRVTQASDLGLNLIHVRFDPQHIVRSQNPEGVNAVADVCSMAQTESLDVCVDDPTVGNTLLGERIMLHPESGYDFYDRGGFGFLYENFFDLVPYSDLNASQTLLDDGGYNCVIIEPGKDTISTPSFARIGIHPRSLRFAILPSSISSGMSSFSSPRTEQGWYLDLF